MCIIRSHRPCTVATLLSGRVTSPRAAGPVTRSVNEETLEGSSCEAIDRVLSLPCSRFGLLSHGAAGPVTRSVNEEALEGASCEAIGRVLSLPCSRVGLLGCSAYHWPMTTKCNFINVPV